MYNIGVDIGGSKVAIGIVDESGKIIYKENVRNDAKISCEDEVENICNNIYSLIEKAGIKEDDINSIGIGFPGEVLKNGLVDAPNICFNSVDLKGEFEKRITNIDILIENDGNCATIGEYVYGGLRNSQNAVLMTLGTGVGGGIIIDQKLYTGITGAGGEIGHQVIVMSGKVCGCGRQGCLEAYASTKALEDRVKENLKNNTDSRINKLVLGNIEDINAEIIFKAIDEDDEFAIKALKEHLMYVAAGIINIINIFDPETIAIGGGVSGAKEKLLNPLMEEIKEQTKNCKFDINKTTIKVAELGNDAGIIGAAELYKFKQ